MAEIKNLTNQLQVVGTGDKFNNSIKFYNKLDITNATILGVKASNGQLVLFNVVNGVEAEAVERFDYTDITLPISTNLEALVLTIHEWIHDTEIPTIIDSVFSGGYGNITGLEIAKDYTYLSATRTVIIDDKDLDFVIGVFNETIGKVLYLSGSEDYTCKRTEGGLIYSRTVEDSTDNDNLLILYKPKGSISDLHLLDDILEEMKTNNKLLTKIYNPE